MGAWGLGALENDTNLNYLSGVRSAAGISNAISQMNKDGYHFGASYAILSLIADSYETPQFTVNKETAIDIIKFNRTHDKDGDSLIGEATIALLYTCCIPLQTRVSIINHYYNILEKQLNIGEYDGYSYLPDSEGRTIEDYITEVLNKITYLKKNNFINPILLTEKHVAKLIDKHEELEELKEIDMDEFESELKSEYAKASSLNVKCINKFRDKTGKIIGYRLQDMNGNIKDFEPNILKTAIIDNKINVINLTLTSDNRLLDKKA